MTRGDGGALPLVRTPGNARQRRAWLCTSAQREVHAWPRHVAMSEATLSGPLARCASGDEQPQAMRHAARSANAARRPRLAMALATRKAAPQAADVRHVLFLFPRCLTMGLLHRYR